MIESAVRKLFERYESSFNKSRAAFTDPVGDEFGPYEEPHR